MKKILSTIVVLAVLLVVGWKFLRNKEDVAIITPTLTASPAETPVVSPESTASPAPVVSKNVVTYIDSGYIPKEITIKKGETVVWKNESNKSMWTASAMHPTHKVYPGTDIVLCNALRPIAMFDSCGRIEVEQSWSFTFNNVGTWGYHNHVNSSHFGKVIVE